MILKKVAIDSFGGLSGMRLNLEQGLNVVLGPNESGKSTIFNALCHCLFTSSKLTATQFKKQMQRFIPVFGGDTISVSVDFDCNGHDYTLARTWGEAQSSTLTLPEGSAITDPAKIKEMIEACLQVSEATSKSIMLAYQSTLSQTLNHLRKDAGTLATLGDILRRSVMEMDGVSVDVLKSRIEDSYTNYFNHWDRDAKYPEKNKGIENPYVKSLGKVTEAFYNKERIRVDLEAAVDHEKELDAINQEITACLAILKEKEDYVDRFKAAKEDALKRKHLASDLKACDLEYANLQKVNRDWPIQEEKHQRLEQKMPGMEEKAQKLKKEKDRIQEAAGHIKRVDKFKSVEGKRRQWEKDQKALQEAKKVTADDLAQMRKIESKLQNLEATMNAGQLNFKLTPEKEIALLVQEGLGNEVSMTASPDRPLSIAVEGSLQISHPDWRMAVAAGEIDIDEMQKSYETLQNKIAVLFKGLQVTTIAQADELSTTYQGRLQKVEHTKKSFEDELGDDDYAALKKAVAEVKDAAPKRDLDSVLSGLFEIQKDLELSKKESADRQSQLEQYEAAYQSQDKLLESLLDVVGRKKEIDKQMASLAPLPEGEDDPDTFIAKYARAEEQAKQLSADKSEYMQEKIRLESTAPDRSVEEFEKDLVEAREQFKEKLRYGEAVARIRETVYQLLEDADAETYHTLEGNVIDLVSKITDNKYTQIEMDESLPIGFKLAGGGTLGYDLLSTGTQDVLAIALRLAFAREFLGEEKSFIMLDDPLVDLDPERQARTAEVIRSFAEDHQVVLFTCHPSHAEQLGGTLIAL